MAEPASSFLGPSARRHAAWATGLCLASIALYLSQPSSLPPNGGSWQGYVLGTLGALLILWLASYMVRYREQLQDRFWGVFKPLAVVGMLGALLLLQPDFGSTVLLCAITAGMLWLGGARVPYLMAPVALGGVGLAALAVFFVPPQWLPAGLSGPAGQPASAPLFPARAASGVDGLPEQAAPAPEPGAADAAASSVATPASTLPEPAGAVRSAAPASVPTLPAAGAPALAVAGDGLLIQTSGESWIEVRDADGRVLLSRLVAPGEQLTGLLGALPLRLVIGNAGAVRVSFRQQPVDLTPATRDNVARLQLPLP